MCGHCVLPLHCDARIVHICVECGYMHGQTQWNNETFWYDTHNELMFSADVVKYTALAHFWNNYMKLKIVYLRRMVIKQIKCDLESLQIGLCMKFVGVQRDHYCVRILIHGKCTDAGRDLQHDIYFIYVCSTIWCILWQPSHMRTLNMLKQYRVSKYPSYGCWYVRCKQICILSIDGYLLEIEQFFVINFWRDDTIFGVL